jgi:hypothetical protein
MPQHNACPPTLMGPDLDREMRIIRMVSAIRGFKTSREATDRLRAAGFSFPDICGGDTAIAVDREVKRQRACGERAAIRTQCAPHDIAPPSRWWSAIYENYDAGDPIGRGGTEFEAILDLVRKQGRA